LWGRGGKKLISIGCRERRKFDAEASGRSGGFTERGPRKEKVCKRKMDQRPEGRGSLPSWIRDGGKEERRGQPWKQQSGQTLPLKRNNKGRNLARTGPTPKGGKKKEGVTKGQIYSSKKRGRGRELQWFTAPGELTKNKKE